MLNKKRAGIFILFFLFLSPTTYADKNGLGQTIQINAHLDTFVGRPSWLVVIRDLDHGQNIPYVFDFENETHFWVAFTYSRNYLVTVSELQFSPYRTNPYGFYSRHYSERKIRNFCHLESHGRILHGESLYVTLKGKLTPYADTYTCHVSQYRDTKFTIATPSTEEN